MARRRGYTRKQAEFEGKRMQKRALAIMHGKAQSRGVVQRNLRRLLIPGIVVLVLASAAFGYYVWDRIAHNRSVPDVESRERLVYHLKRYAEVHDGWYPRDGLTPIGSLSLAIYRDDQVSLFTCPEKAAEATRYWRENNALTDDLTCYGYNEGLREDDPYGAVVVYMKQPSLWKSPSEEGEDMGRWVLLTARKVGLAWEWLNDERFELRQRRTLQYLKDEGRLKAETERPGLGQTP